LEVYTSNNHQRAVSYRNGTGRDKLHGVRMKKRPISGGDVGLFVCYAGAVI